MKKKKITEEAASVPGWIVSFSDMVTLLLAFFVLLQTFAHTQDPELFFAGQGSFNRAISGFGVSMMFEGHSENLSNDYRKLKYPTDSTEDKGRLERSINVNDEQIREIFKHLQETMDTKADDLKTASLSVLSTPITFAKSSTELNSGAKRYLKEFSRDLQGTVRDDVTIYVIAMAPKQRTDRAKWQMSARRAACVQKFLSRELSSGGEQRWNVYSWGAGDGHRQSGSSAGDIQVVIAVMGAQNRFSG